MKSHGSFVIVWVLNLMVAHRIMNPRSLSLIDLSDRLHREYPCLFILAVLRLSYRSLNSINPASIARVVMDGRTLPLVPTEKDHVEVFVL